MFDKTCFILVLGFVCCLLSTKLRARSLLIDAVETLGDNDWKLGFVDFSKTLLSESNKFKSAFSSDERTSGECVIDPCDKFESVFGAAMVLRKKLNSSRNANDFCFDDEAALLLLLTTQLTAFKKQSHNERHLV